MSEERLTMVETASLIILMSAAGPLPNARLGDDHKCRLEKKSREKLERLKLIEVERVSRNRIVLTLADRGWVWCAAELESGTLPLRPGAAGGALYALLRRLGRFLATQRVNLPDFIAASGDQADVEERIRTAYRRLAPEPGAWVNVADLRERLAGVPADAIDAALRRLNRQPGVSLVPEANQKALDARTRKAAVVIGDQAKHSISMGAS